jgi:hypothetical protein
MASQMGDISSGTGTPMPYPMDIPHRWVMSPAAQAHQLYTNLTPHSLTVRAGLGQTIRLFSFFIQINNY